VAQEGEDGQPPSREVTGYRTPRYPVFVVTGAVLGLLAGVGLALFGGSSTAVGGSGVLGYFAAFGTLLGALVGGTVAVLAESFLNRGRRGRRGRRG
jgi:hypothetical protein